MAGKNSKRTLYRIYALAVFLGGLAVLGVLSRSLSPIDWLSETTATMVLWVTMVVIAAMSPIPLPRGGGSLRLTTALDIGAILVFGPALACWVGLSSRLVTNFTEGWNPFLPGVARLGQCLFWADSGRQNALLHALLGTHHLRGRARAY